MLAGILNLLLCPFIMTLMLFYFLLKHAEEIHGHRAKVRRRRQTRGPRAALRGVVAAAIPCKRGCRGGSPL